jgi:hypothetical protein
MRSLFGSHVVEQVAAYQELMLSRIIKRCEQKIAIASSEITGGPLVLEIGHLFDRPPEHDFLRRISFG